VKHRHPSLAIPDPWKRRTTTVPPTTTTSCDLSDDLTEAVEEAVEVVEEAVEVEEEAAEDYPRQQDQACFPHMDELLIQNF
jgi:hypothetical protein